MRFHGIPKGLRGGSALFVSASAAIWIWHMWKVRQLRKKALAKRQKEQEYISSQLDLLSQEIDQELAEKILALTAPELLDQLRNGILKPVDVLKVYIHKACRVTKSLNCVTEVIRGSRDIAENLSDKNPKDLPLYGLPVSVKECYRTKGSVSTAGLAKFLDDVEVDDCVIVKVLKHCGAVPFVKTNIPQMMLSFESSNPIYGETSNPHNQDFAPGGSSAGEGSMLGAGASPLGFGTDIAGSVRVPSHFCGGCALKPTENRLSKAGMRGSLPGQSALHATVGPMARDVDMLVLAMRALLCDTLFQLDTSIPPMYFREEIFASKEPMRIGYYEDDGYMEPVPACKRAVRMTKEALESAGHTLVPYRVPDIEKVMELATEAVYADGGKRNTDLLREDAVDKRLRYTWRRWKMSPIIRKIFAWLLSFKSSRMSKDLMAYGGGDKSVFRLWNITAEMQAYKAKFWAEWREKYKIDAVICPVYPMVACPKGMVDNMSAWMSYSVLHTLVNCPAGVVTITKVTEEDIRDLENHRGHYGDYWDRHVKKACQGSINMPVGVQCVTAPWQEERCLRLMKEVENLLVKDD